MKNFFIKILLFIFKPVIPIFCFAYFIRPVSYFVLKAAFIYCIFYCIVYVENRDDFLFIVIIGGLIGLFLLSLYLFDKHINKDMLLMKKRKGVIINDICTENLSDVKNNDVDSQDDINDVEDDENNEDSIKKGTNYLIGGDNFLVVLARIFSEFWLWVFLYGIYAYLVRKDFLPVVIAIIILILNKLLYIKKS